jgi:SNF2 family DNA or RNA helicase
MGLGKTLITLSALMDINPICHVLAIAPLNIARSVWQDEIDKWNMPIRTKSLVVNERGTKLTKAKRIELFGEISSTKPSLFFINRELIGQLVDYFIEQKKPWPFPFLIIDEAQSFKSQKSQRFIALKKVLPSITHIVELSGTPSPGGLLDILSQIYLLDRGERLGKIITAYKKQYFIPNPHILVNGHPVKWDIKQGADKEIEEKISDIVISMKNDMLRLPPLIINDINVYMNDAEKSLYRKMKRDFVLPLENDLAIVAQTAAVLYAKLSQMASGTIYTGVGSQEYTVIHREKLDLCLWYAIQAQSPTIIAYHFKSEREEIYDYFKNSGMEAVIFNGSKHMQDEWNKGNYQVMLLHPMSAGHGLNIQFGGRHLIWYTLPDSLESYLQTMARLHRQGQNRPVIVHRLIAKGTIDEQKVINLARKDGTQQGLLNAVKATIAKGI